MATKFEFCPFKKGDLVTYWPSAEGFARVRHTWAGELDPGKQYRVADIQEYRYLVIEGFEDRVGGGLHWSEFKAVS